MEIKFTVLSRERNVTKNFWSTPDINHIFERWVEENNLDVDGLVVIDTFCDTFDVSCLMKHSENVEIFVQVIQDLFEYSTAKQLYDALSEKGDLECSEWLEFNEDFFRQNFTDPYESARATFFGNVNWNDEYVRFDGYNNLKTTNEVDYDFEKNEILKLWLDEFY
ncbi:hypothetical protein [Streptococcus sp. S784/96/1]|uniref:hypothetical protein n=1 Tax=Streptococcus sp. S784/96/1 TaxID=2653499 RepID=UPI0013866F26|nr:hypothetical protein [Streptococcus sp. S784/96/1]